MPPNITLDKVENFIGQGYYGEAVDSCFKIIGIVLTDYYNKIFPSLSLEKQQKIIADLKDNFSEKRFMDLYYGAKIKIFLEYKLFSETNLKFTKDCNISSFYSLLKELRPKLQVRADAAHPEKNHVKFLKESKTVSKAEAYETLALLIKFLDTLNIEIPYAKSNEKILTKLPPKDYFEFIGRKKQVKEVKEILLNEKVFILSIDGIGGVGKSTLALEVAYELKKEKIFDAIMWITAKKDNLTLNGIESITPEMNNLEDLLNIILQLFEDEEFFSYDLDTRKKKVLKLLSENHCLLIIDNLETIIDSSLKEFIVSLEFPKESKVMVTSRERLGDFEKVYFLDQFSKEETREYINSQLGHRSYEGIINNSFLDKIHDMVGGIPLAIKVIIPWIIEGKLTPQNIKDLNDIDEGTDICNFCFGKLYSEFLSDEARNVMLLLSKAPLEISDTCLRYLAKAIFNMEDYNYSKVLRELHNYALIYEKSATNGRDNYFYMLPLTRKFFQDKARENLPVLKQAITRYYLKFLEMMKRSDFSSKRAMAMTKVDDARRQLSNRQFKKAVNSIKEAITYDYEFAEAQATYAIIRKEQEHYQSAERHIRLALKFEPDNSNYWAEYSIILEASNNFIRAEEILNSALKKKPNDLFLKRRLLIIKHHLHKHDEVIQLAKATINRNPKNDEDYWTNTELLIAILKAYWQKTLLQREDNKISIKSATFLEKAINEFDNLFYLVVQDNRTLKFYEKRISKQLGNFYKDKAKQKALEFYNRGLYEKTYNHGTQKHNDLVNSLIQQISNDSSVAQAD